MIRKFLIILILGYFVSFFTEHKNSCIKIGSFGYQSEAGNVPAAKDIFVNDVSSNEDGMRSVFNRGEFLRSRSLGVLQNVQRCTRSNERPAAPFCGIVGNREIGIIHGSYTFNKTGFATQSWSFAGIQKRDFQFQDAVFHPTRSRIWNQIGAELPLGSFTSRPNLPNERNKLEATEKSQDPGEDHYKVIVYRRACILFLGGLGGFLLALVSVTRCCNYGWGRILWWCLAAFGLICGEAAIVLWALMLFYPPSLKWPI